MPDSFEIVCEIEPPTRPDLMHVRHQIGVLSKISAAFLIPDNHIGRATVSSVAVAHEVGLMGGRSIACLNARDRNLLGFRRDLLTAAAYGVDQFLFVYGDRPSSGARTAQLTVRSMIEELRSFPFEPSRSAVSCRRHHRYRQPPSMEARRRFPLRSGVLLARRRPCPTCRHRLRRTGLRRCHGGTERRDGGQARCRCAAACGTGSLDRCHRSRPGCRH